MRRWCPTPPARSRDPLHHGSRPRVLLRGLGRGRLGKGHLHDGYLERPRARAEKAGPPDCHAGALLQATEDHVVFTTRAGETVERPAGDIAAGDTLALIALPEATNAIALSEEEAWLLGVLVAAGRRRAQGDLRVIHPDARFLDRVAACWRALCAGQPTRIARPNDGDKALEIRLAGEDAFARSL